MVVCDFGLVVGWGFLASTGIPCEFAPLPRVPLHFVKGRGPLCPSDISPASGGNPAMRPPLGSWFCGSDGGVEGLNYAHSDGICSRKPSGRVTVWGSWLFRSLFWSITKYAVAMSRRLTDVRFGGKAMRTRFVG